MPAGIPGIRHDPTKDPRYIIRTQPTAGPIVYPNSKKSTSSSKQQYTDGEAFVSKDERKQNKQIDDSASSIATHSSKTSLLHGWFKRSSRDS